MTCTKALSLALSISTFAVSGQPISFPLEWNASYSTAVPYEVEISPAKLTRLLGVAPQTGFAVTAHTDKDDVPLTVTQAAGRTAETLNLHFNVPAGTQRLTCSVDEKAACPPLPDTANLFAGCLVPRAWQVSPNGRLELDGMGKIRIRAIAPGDVHARCRITLPPNCAGVPVKTELDVMNIGKLTTGGTIRFAQYDVHGHELPESVTDPRWTTHMRPPQKLIPLREAGRIHPQAHAIELCITLRMLNTAVDEYGLPLKSTQDLWPSLALSRLAVRTAATLPFPKYNDSFFTRGASGNVADTALVLGGDRAFWYNTHSQGCWAEGRQFENPRDVFWPDHAGTVEAFLCPNWTEDRTYSIFTASHRYNSNEARLIRPKNECLTLTYRPGTKTFAFTVLDWNGKVFKGSVQAAFPTGQWTHVALQWQPGQTARLFVQGRVCATVPLTDFEPWNLSRHTDVKPNGRIPLEFYVGANYVVGRITDGFPGTSSTFYTGAIDNLRISSICRYDANFTPSTTLQSDIETRALFTFDRSFDGVSGGGWGWIPGTLFAPTDRVEHRLMANTRTVDYFAPTIEPANDPFKVFSTLNYPVLPQIADFRQARHTVTKTCPMKIGERIAFTCPQGTVPEFVEIVNTGTTPLVHPAVINRGEFDPRSFADLADSLLDGRASLSDREKVNAVFQFVIGASDYFMQHTVTFPPESDQPEMVVYKALTMLNGYCGFECGPLNSMTANLLACVARCPSSSTFGYGHEFEQVFFDGKNHTYDMSAQKFFPAMDNETASCLGESEDQIGLYNRLGTDGGSFIRSYTRGWSGGIPFFQPKVAITLNPGESFKVWQGNDGHVNDLHIHYWAKGEDPAKSSYREDYTKQTHAVLGNPQRQFLTRMDRFFPHYLNGFITFDGAPTATNPAFCEVTPSSFVYRVASCYPIVHGEYAATRADGTPLPVALSTDGGRTYRAIPTMVDYEVRARTAYRLRVEAPLAAVANWRAVTEVMVNPRVFPGKVHAGDNSMLLKATTGERATINFGWRENIKPIDVAGSICAGTIPGFEHQFLFLKPNKTETFAVTGLSDHARVDVRSLAAAFGKTALTATLKGGTLALTGQLRGGDSAWTSIRITDGLAEKDVYVLVSSTIQYIPAAKAHLAGQATFTPASATDLQDTISFVKSGDAARFDFTPVKAGTYAVFFLDRFPSNLQSPGLLNRNFFRINWEGNPERAPIYTGSGANQGVNLYKARYGNLKGRAQFKWDYVLDNVGYHPYFPRYKPRALTFPEGTHAVTFTADENRAERVELAAVLILPQQEREFFCATVKLLCGLNCEPARVSAPNTRHLPAN